MKQEPSGYWEVFDGKIKNVSLYKVLIFSEWLKFTTQETTDVGKDVEKGEPTISVGGNANWCNHSGKQCEVPQKIKNRITTQRLYYYIFIQRIQGCCFEGAHAPQCL